MKKALGVCAPLVLIGPCLAAAAGAPAKDTSRGDRMMAEYFRQETARLGEACLQNVKTLEDWQSLREEYRRQFLEMLGLDPLPPKTDLQAVVTGKLERDDFTVENIHFQSRPGLYVTGNLYLPKGQKGPAPAILYVCGHGTVKKDGISYGSKAAYHHHGCWFARHGYVCLTIDTLQLGEIEGIHHGTYRYGMWWWLNRGYTPAGVEAWNCVRALDYLETRKEVDPTRMGVTGRSGGGGYSWWISAIDDRIKVAVPVAGITDLQNQVVDGSVEGHCDCMFFVNTYRWDYPLVAALVAPRPLLISNSDSDGLFPLDGVIRTFEKARRIYALYKAADKVGLCITPGPHRDTQELQVNAFRWFNRHLKGDNSQIAVPAEKLLEPSALRVFQELPKDEQNTRIQETFVPPAPAPPVPGTAAQWQALRDSWRSQLLKKTFAAWPQQPEPLNVQPVFSAEHEGLRFEASDFTSQGPVRLRLYAIAPARLAQADRLRLVVLDDAGWAEFLAAVRCGFERQLNEESLPPADTAAWARLRQSLMDRNEWVGYLPPRGVGPTAWDQSERKQIQVRRRFYLLGQTLDGMRVWDVQRAIQAVLATPRRSPAAELALESHRAMAGVALHASLFQAGIAELDLYDLPATHRDGPYLLNVSRILETPQAVAMAAERTRVVLHQARAADWEYPRRVAQQLGWKPDQLTICDGDVQPPARKTSKP